MPGGVVCNVSVEFYYYMITLFQMLVVRASI